MTTIPDLKPFIISREFAAPRELIWKAWTEPGRLMQWFGPKGSAMPAAKMDLRPSGICHFRLRSPDGRELWGKFIYREIVAPERLVYAQHFSDVEGGLTRHPLNPAWPLHMLTAVTFARQKGKTLLAVRWDPINPTPEESASFDAGRDGMSQGWGGSLDRLGDYLAKV